MRIRRSRATKILVLTTATILCSSALAQDPSAGGGSGSPPSSVDRLFLSFVEDAAVPESQWWEGQVEFDQDGPTGIDTIIGRGVAAFQVIEDLEVGGRVGFGSTDAPRGLSDGSGATDFDLWGKYRMVGSTSTEFAFGGLFTIPTGDDQAGLGYDSFSFAAFGAVRHRLQKLAITGNVGARFNDDGMVHGFRLEGRTSVFLAGGVIAPLSDALSVVGELRVEGERYRGLDEDARVLGGINWRLSNRSLIRGSIALGLADGAPDSQLIVGYAYTF